MPMKKMSDSTNHKGRKRKPLYDVPGFKPKRFEEQTPSGHTATVQRTKKGQSVVKFSQKKGMGKTKGRWPD